MGCLNTKVPTQGDGKEAQYKVTERQSSVRGSMNSNFEEQEEETEQDKALEAERIKAAGGRRRRSGIMASPVTDRDMADYKKPVFQKDKESRDRIMKLLKENDKLKVLFGHLSDGQLSEVVDAFDTKALDVGTVIIRQGDEGDCLYVMKEGTVDVFVKRGDDDSKDGRGNKVVTLGADALFGELALMYNSPRQATVVAATPVSLWKLQALDFKMILTTGSQARLNLYEGWLSKVKIFQSLTNYELGKLADLLGSQTFDAGETIVRQGDIGENFYILQDGDAQVMMAGGMGDVLLTTYEEQGDYFGEIALLKEEPRKASVKAGKGGCTVGYISKQDFTSVLGPISTLLRKNIDEYPEYAKAISIRSSQG